MFRRTELVFIPSNEPYDPHWPAGLPRGSYPVADLPVYLNEQSFLESITSFT